MSTQPPRPGELDGSVGSDGSGASARPAAGRQPADHVPPPGGHQPRDHVPPPSAREHGAGVPTTAWRAEIGSDEADRAARTYWDAEADSYQAEHGAFLAGNGGGVAGSVRSGERVDVRGERWVGERPGMSADTGVRACVGFVWGPEGRTEAELGMLGPIGGLAGRRVLEVGCGAAQCSAWLAKRGVHAMGVDIAVNQLRHAIGAGGAGGARAGTAEPSHAHPPEQSGGVSWLEPPSATRFRDGRRGEVGTASPDRADDRPGRLHVVAAAATALPFADATFDAAFSAYGAVQFVADLPQLLGEVRRVLVPGGRWAFSVTHPIRWAFPDEPGPEGLSVSGSYFDRTPYVERDDSGAAVYAEFHWTVGDYVSALVSAGFNVDRVVEPEWPDWNESTWGGWSPLRGMHLPGTLIIGCRAGGG